ncbi:MAG: peptidylprolyl isomerase [Alphaproteobacteria bacterium]|nr:peptidylprolyl isomerase [Alphaproteobacteria bacterium]
MKKLLFAALLGMTTAMATPAFAESDYTVLKLDGKEYKKSRFERELKNILPGNQDVKLDTFPAKVREEIVKKIATNIILAEEADKAGMKNDPEVKERLLFLEAQVMIDAYLRKKAKDVVTEDAIKSEYRKIADKEGGKDEIKASHILVKTEDEAKDVVKRLKAGEEFAKIAKEKSTDPGSAQKGGDLGYFTKEQMVPEFANAAFGLDKGKVSDPVKTDFGWHVIQVEDKRKVQVPELDKVRPQIEAQLTQKFVQESMNKVLSGKKIEVLGPDGKKLEDKEEKAEEEKADSKSKPKKEKEKKSEKSDDQEKEEKKEE